VRVAPGVGEGVGDAVGVGEGVGDGVGVGSGTATGAEEPYEKLKRALRAEIDEAAWSALYSTRSYPFDQPSTGKIAVKVINHYGDEVLKVYEV